MLSGTSHSSTVPSTDPDAISVPSDENATAETHPICPENVAICFCVETSHSLAVKSHDPEASFVPSGESAMELIVFPCPCNVARFCPVSTAQILMVLSSDPEASSVPSREYATDVRCMAFQCSFLYARRYIPQTDVRVAYVVTATCQRGAIWTECDASNVRRMPLS